MPCKRDHVEIIDTPARGRVLKARLRDREIGELGIVDQPARMRHVLGIEIVAFKGDVGIGGGEQRQAETLAEAEFEHAFRPHRPARRAADRKRGKGHVARRKLAVKAGGVADVGNVASGPVHRRLLRRLSCTGTGRERPF